MTAGVVPVTWATSDLDGLPVLDVAPGHLVRCAQQLHANL